jgi:predicted  nucleic acid-binding Zn-ribbon protein
VRVSDLTLELQAMRGRIQQLQKNQGAVSAEELATLREDLEAQRAENEFLSAELERTSERLQELQSQVSQGQSGSEDLTIIRD